MFITFPQNFSKRPSFPALGVWVVTSSEGFANIVPYRISIVRMDAVNNLLSIIVDGRWQPSVGDPTIVGWAIFAAYIAAALLCVRCAVVEGRMSLDRGAKKRRVFWWVVAIILLLLAVNKELDLQTWLTEVAMRMAKEQGWYDRYSTVQLWFASAVAAAGLFSIAVGMWLMRPLRGCRLAFFGLVILVVFIFGRIAAGPLWRVMQKYFTLEVRQIVEFAGILCVAVSAAINSIKLRKSRT